MIDKEDRGCVLCGKDCVEDYIVYNEVWEDEVGLVSSHPDYFVIAHVTCLEDRLGRELTLRDFPPTKINLEFISNYIRCNNPLYPSDQRPRR